MNAISKKGWTRPYYGNQYLSTEGNEGSSRRPYVSITQVGEIYILKKWFNGCGFSPKQERFKSEDSAKADGTEWLETA